MYIYKSHIILKRSNIKIKLNHPRRYTCSHISARCTFKSTYFMYVSQINYICTVHTTNHRTLYTYHKITYVLYSYTTLHVPYMNQNNHKCSGTYAISISRKHSSFYNNLLGFRLMLSFDIDPKHHIRLKQIIEI